MFDIFDHDDVTACAMNNHINTSSGLASHQLMFGTLCQRIPDTSLPDDSVFVCRSVGLDALCTTVSVISKVLHEALDAGS